MLRKSIAAALLLSATVSQAESPPGLYLGAGIGQSTVKEDIFGESFKGTDTAGTIFGGFQFNPNLAVEAAYIDGGSPDDTIDGVAIAVDAKAFQAALRAIWPFSDTFSGYAKAGVVFWDSEVSATDGFDFVSESDSGNDFSYGLGFEAGKGKGRARLEWQHIDVDGTKWDILGVGFVWML